MFTKIILDYENDNNNRINVEYYVISREHEMRLSINDADCVLETEAILFVHLS